MCGVKETMCAAWVMALAVSLGEAVPVVPQKEDHPTSPLPAEIVAGWQKAGALAGWLELTRDGDIIGDTLRDREAHDVLRFGEQGKDGEVPTFRFKEWRPGVLRRLPLPQRG